MQLEPTGERMIVEEYHSTAADHLIYLMHLASYEYAQRYTAGKRVLDYGCGSGYGSDRVANSAAAVTGVDVASDAIEHAHARFRRENLRFLSIAPDACLPFSDASFDVVLSFQVFEHIRDIDGYLREVRRVLAPHGTLVLITPDRRTRLLPMQQPWNRWHVTEYSPTKLHRIVCQYFPAVQILGMSARPDVIQIELRRCRRIKWLTLPATLPFLPTAIRVALLNAIHRVRGRAQSGAPPREYPFSINDIEISESAAPSVNIVAVCDVAPCSKSGPVTE